MDFNCYNFVSMGKKFLGAALFGAGRVIGFGMGGLPLVKAVLTTSQKIHNLL